MLTFDPPYTVIDGYTLLSDHEDPTRWYALPPTPRLAVDASGRPMLSLLEYLGGDGAARHAGGVLELTTVLDIPDDVLGTLGAKLKDHLGDRAPAAVAVTQALFDSGTVELVALGSTSPVPDGSSPQGEGQPSGSPTVPGPDSGAAAAGPSTGSTGQAQGSPAGNGPFTIAFSGSGRPSLGGDNRAVFQLVLDEPSTALIDACLDAPELPVIVIYRLQLSGLRPSFSIKVDADWSKVYTELKSRLNANTYYVAADVEAAVTTALEHDGVKIDETIYGSGPGAAAGAERARKALLDWVTGRLFTPLVDSSAATANAVGQVIDDTVFSLTRALLPGLGMKLRAVSDTELRSMSARMDETVAERREIVPQGTLGGLLNAVRTDASGSVRPTWAALRASLVRQVDVASFPRLTVQVGVEDRFASDGVQQVTVDLARVGDDGSLQDAASFALRSASDIHTYAVNLLGRATAQLARPYRWRADVAFNPAGPFGAHPPVSIDWRDGDTELLVVEPRAAYWCEDVEVAASPTFSWTSYPAVEVDLHYAEPDAAAEIQHGHVVLTPTSPSGTWRFRAVSADRPAFTAQVVCDRASGTGAPLVQPPQVLVDTLLTVPDPMPAKRRLNVFVSLPWSQIATAFLELAYRDDAHGISTDEQIDLGPTTPYIRRDLPMAQDGPKSLSYRLTVMFTDGRLLEGSWRSTDDERLVVDRSLVDSRAVTVRLVGGPLADRGLAEVHVRLEVDDPVTGAVRAQTEIVVDADSQGTPPAPWSYLAGDPPAQGVRYQAVFIDAHGFATTTSWATATSDLLVVSLAARTIAG